MVILVVQHIHVGALPTELLSQVIKYSSVGSAVAFLGQIALFKRRRPSEKGANFCILNGTPQLTVIIRILIYGEVHKIKLDKTLFPNWRHILPQNKNNVTVKKLHGTAVGIIVVVVYLFVEFR